MLHRIHTNIGHAIDTAGAIGITSSHIDARNKQKNADQKSPFAYLYQSQRNGI